MNVLITGAASGIGYALTLKLIKNGHMVYLCVHNDNEIKTVLEKVKSIEYQDRVSVIKLNILKEKDRDLITRLDIDCLINMAAIGVGGSLLNMDVSEIKKVFDTNFFSVLELIKLYIETRKGKNGKIIVVSSIAALIPVSFLGSYCSSKAALSSFLVSLNREIKKSKYNIDLKLIEPGLYKTGFNQYMIDSKNGLDSSFFNISMEDVSNFQRKMFDILEYKTFSSIVNKINSAVDSCSCKFIYRAPFFHILLLKFYLTFIK